MKTRESQELEAAVTVEGISQVIETDHPTPSTLSVAINEQYIDKKDRNGGTDRERLTTGFVNYELTARQLADHINEGHAFTSQHKGRRASKNFTQTSVIAIDLDSRVDKKTGEGHLADIKGALSDTFVQSYIGIFYHTASHQEDFPKARLVFLLDQPITDAAFYKKAVTMLIERLEKYGADPSTKDPVRVFYGFKDSNPKVYDNTLKLDTLRDMVDSWETEKQERKKVVAALEHTFHRSRSKDASTDAYRISELLSYIPPQGDYDQWLRVLMAVHSALGMEGIRLVEEWSPGYPGEAEEKFRSFEHNTPEQPVGIGTLFHLAIRYGWNPLFSVTPTKLVHQEYLSNTNPISKLTAIKSPKGTGKTTTLTQQVVEAGRVLFIGHRITLLMEAAARHGLEFYQEFEGDKEGLNSAQKLAITLDSLIKLDPKQWLDVNLLVIDEVEQVLRHLTGDTVRKVRRNLQAILTFLLTKAKRVVILDADLTDVAVETIKAMAGTEDDEVIVNTHKPKPLTFVEYGKPINLINHAFANLASSKRIFMTTNTKAKAKELAEAIRTKFPNLKGLTITSDNSQESAIQEFVQHINDRILNYDYIVTSPSLGTGISIDVEGIEAVYLLAESFDGLNHTDLLQQVGRVRNPDSRTIHFCIKGQRFQPWTNDKVLKKVALREAELSGVQFDIDPATGEKFVLNDPHEERYLKLWSKSKARHNLSTNNLKGRFTQHLLAEGHNLEDGEDAPQEEQDTIKEALKIAKKVQEEHYINGILEAPHIDYFQYNSLKKRDRKTEADRRAIENYLIRDTFGVEGVTADLIRQYGKGRARYQMFNYIDTFEATEAELLNKDSYERNNLIPDRHHHLETVRLRRELIAKAFGCSVDEALTGEVCITDAILEANGFKQWATENKPRIQQLLQLNGKPSVTLVTDLLQQLGLKLQKQQVRGGSISSGLPSDGTLKNSSFIETDNSKCSIDTPPLELENPLPLKRGDRLYTITGVQEMQAQLQRREAQRLQRQQLEDSWF